MAEADVVLLVIDAANTENADGMGAEDEAVLQRARESGSAVLLAWNKTDLVQEPKFKLQDETQAIATSAVTGQGTDELRAAIVRAVAGDARGLRESGMLTNLRQHQAIERALIGLDAATSAIDTATPHEMLLLDLYEALRGLDALTGATTNEDVLRLIFSTFCIGK
jgi:tRNA modification GTPase